MALTRTEAINHPMMKKNWYYCLELQPGVFTPGREHRNIILTRDLLRRISVEGCNCLDIGTMEGLVSILLLRRGAGNVTSYDRIDFSEWIRFIEENLAISFNYTCGYSLNHLKTNLAATGLAPFDVVIFSGVLYHMFDPLAGLAIVRGLTRNGGLMLIETSAVFTEKDECLMHFNNSGRFFPGTNYWQISVSCLDYLLRTLRYELLDVSFYKGAIRDGIRQGRIAVVCRAVNKPISSPGDEWMPKTAKEGGMPDFLPDFREYIDWHEISEKNNGDVPYASPPPERYLHPGTQSLSLFQTVNNSPETKLISSDDQVRLKLDALY